MLSAALVAALGVAGVWAPVNAAEAWVSSRHLVSIYPAENSFIINIDGAPLSSSSGCSSNQLIVPQSAANYQVLSASFLTAFTSSNLLDINYNDPADASCRFSVNRAVVYK
jgi:hypothetical protein